MLLAAGRGDRMEPLSSLIAKSALEILGVPLLASGLRALERAGCRRIVVNTHRHADQVEHAARAVASATTEVIISAEPKLLGSGGGIAAARRWFGPDGVLVANGDVWADCDLAPLLAAGNGDEIVLAVVPHPDPARWSSVVIAPDGTVEAIAPRGAAFFGRGFLFTGFQRIGAEVVAALPAPPSEIQPVWEALRRCGRLRAVVVEGTWREAGTPAAYRTLVLDLLGGASWAHDGASVEPSARISNAAVGAGCRVGAGAVVTGTIVTAGAGIGPGAVVSDSIVAGSVEVTAGAKLAGKVRTPAGDFPLTA